MPSSHSHRKRTPWSRIAIVLCSATLGIAAVEGTLRLTGFELSRGFEFLGTEGDFALVTEPGGDGRPADRPDLPFRFDRLRMPTFI